MTENRERLQRYDVDGLPIFYRVSNEKGRLKLHITFWTRRKHKRPGSSDRGRLGYQETHLLPAGAENTPMCVLSALRKYAPGFWCRLLHSEKEQAQKALADFVSPEEGLPLAVAWAADKDDMAAYRQWTETTVRRKEKLIGKMLAWGWGSVPIGALDDKYCGATFLEMLSPNEHKESIALLRQLAQHEISSKRLKANPWVGRTVSRPAKKLNSRQCVDRHIRTNTLTNGQVRQSVTALLDHITPGQQGKYPLAALLVLAMGIPLPELCYLRLGAIVCHPDGRPFAMHIEGTCKAKRKKVVTEVAYSDESPKNRILPLPALVADALQPLLDAWRERESPERYQTRYLLPSQKGSQRKTDFRLLEQWINSNFSKEFADTRFCDGKGKTIEKSSRTASYHKMLKTVELALLHEEIEADEYNWYFGRAPKSVAAEYYADFANVSEQRHIAAFLDARLPTVSKGEHVLQSADVQNPSNGTLWEVSSPGQVAQVLLTLHLPPVPEAYLPEQDYAIQLSCRCGLSIDARFDEGTPC